MDIHENYLELIVLVNDVEICILGCENLDWTHSKLMVAVMKSCLLFSHKSLLANWDILVFSGK